MGSIHNYPPQLKPCMVEAMTLLTGQSVEVAKAMPVFVPWTGSLPGDTYNGKAVLDYHGQPAFAELVILRSFQDHGWDGVWIDTYRRKFRTGYWDVEPLESLPSTCPDLIRGLLGTWSGAWDVCCWRGDQIVFAESKRRASDRIRDSQRQFLARALAAGVPLSSFLLVEWTV